MGLVNHYTPNLESAQLQRTHGRGHIQEGTTVLFVSTDICVWQTMPPSQLVTLLANASPMGQGDRSGQCLPNIGSGPMMSQLIPPFGWVV